MAKQKTRTGGAGQKALWLQQRLCMKQCTRHAGGEDVSVDYFTFLRQTARSSAEQRTGEEVIVLGERKYKTII